MNTLLSVIIPTYNRSKYIKDVVDSIINLLDNRTEIIIVDDASTDDTSCKIAHLKEIYGYNRIISIQLDKNSGAQVARNCGMEAARGELILFCDSDDVSVASGVAALAHGLSQNPDVDYAYGKVMMTDASLKPLVGVVPIGSAFEDCPFEMAGYHWHTMGALYRKSYLEKVGLWNPALTGSQDWEYQARVKLAGGRGLFVDTLVGYWRQHEGGRVGARKFRPDYVRSVVTACDVIISESRAKGKCDRSLQRRLAKKLIIHALESGAHGDMQLRRQCLSHAATAVSDDMGILLLIMGLQLTPSWFDGMIWSCFF